MYQHKHRGVNFWHVIFLLFANYIYWKTCAHISPCRNQLRRYFSMLLIRYPASTMGNNGTGFIQKGGWLWGENYLVNYQLNSSLNQQKRSTVSRYRQVNACFWSMKLTLILFTCHYLIIHFSFTNTINRTVLANEVATNILCCDSSAKLSMFCTHT